ncbi:ATPase inhibitor, mitochondrial [Otolemur garnettii]|uniref:ATPase inhibitor, mitochondrial n=1 Tax=Otolemur garnettii TaxID=30611 RepID=H0X2G2_OTOGA|nr:ATPase inhibitor, mitochondrial [Otolemur garnettii]
MAVSAQVVRSRFGMWGVKAVQARGFASDQPSNVDRSAGSIREAGGAFGKKEQAEEERYFRAQAKEQLAALKKHHEDEIGHHKREIERLQKEIERHKQKIKKLNHDD